jgi:hypothetical protein
MSWRRHAATLGFFTLFAIVHTWPLALAPHRWSRIDNGDYSLNAWTMAWVAHQAPRDPLHLFDANIFHPERRTLAYSEHLVPQSVIAAPVLWAGGSAVLAYNLTLLAGFVLSGWAMTLVVARWTSDWTAGLIAGSLLAFNTHTLTRLPQIQALHNQFLPFALLALDQAIAGGNWRASVRAGVFSALQGLTSGYTLVFTMFGMAAATFVRIREWWPRRVPQVVAAALVAALILAPFLVPYWLNWRERGLSRSLDRAGRYAAHWIDYATTAGRLHLKTPLKWGYETDRERREKLFPGVTATVLALVALATGLAWRDRRARMCLALGVTGLVLSFGPRTPLYEWLYAYVPLLQGVRIIARFGWLVLVAVAVLAGFGLAWLRRRFEARWAGRRRALEALTAALLLFVHAEALQAPFEYHPFDGISRVYEVVAELPDNTVLAEFPFYDLPLFHGNATYMLSSTVHWKPMLNGYSGFAPDSYRRMGPMLRAFPSTGTIDALRAAGVTDVVVHLDQYGKEDDLTRRIEDTGQFEMVAGDDDVRLYRLIPR